MSTLLEYKVKIKEWEKNFALKHGKQPSKSDIKADTEIRKAYKVYNELKKGTSSVPIQPSQKQPQNPIQKPPKASKSNQKPPLELTDEEETNVVRNAELGPTPQAYGKVMSLFDLMSPPNSSPIKRGLAVKNALHAAAESPSKPDLFKTPTKSVKRIDPSNVTPSRSNVMERLRTVAAETHDADIMETPFYLGKTTSKFCLSDALHASQESPSKPASKPALIMTPQKPTLSQEEFQASPSPLKSQRYLSFGGTKKVSQIFQEFQSLAAAQDFEEQKREIDMETSQVQELLRRESDTQKLEEAPSLARKRKKALTQKRTTRRWKIKPRSMEEGADSEKKDVHEEMHKLQQANQAELEMYMNGAEEESEASADESEDTDEDHETKRILPNPNLSTKINPISNNYQRLKINDPRAKKFKQRMKRR